MTMAIRSYIMTYMRKLGEAMARNDTRKLFLAVNAYKGTTSLLSLSNSFKERITCFHCVSTYLAKVSPISTKSQRFYGRKVHAQF